MPRELPRRLLRAAQTSRDRALVAVLYYAGLRAFEASGLDWEDVNFEERQLHIRHGKGDKEAYLPISKRLLGYLEEHQRQSPSGGPVFRNQRGERLRRGGVWYAVKHVARLARLDPERVWPHLLRHAFVSEMLSSGADIVHVRDAARHSNIATTDLYSHINAESLRDTVELLDAE